MTGDRSILNGEAPPENPEQPQRQNQSQFMGTIALIPQFSGKPDGIPVKSFIKKVTAAGRLSSCSEEQLSEIAKLKLSGLAMDFLDAHPELESAKWSELSEKLSQRFGEPETPQENKFLLKDCVQKQGETVQDYATRLRQLGYKTLKNGPDNEERKIRLEVMEEDLLAQFLKGVNIEVRQSTYNINPKNLDEAAKEAHRQERYVLANKSSTVGTVCAITPTPAPRSSAYQSERPSRRSEYERNTPSSADYGRSQNYRTKSPQNYYRRDRTPSREARPEQNDGRRNSSRGSTPYRGRSQSVERNRPTSRDRNQNGSRRSRGSCFYCDDRSHIEAYFDLKRKDSEARKAETARKHAGRSDNRRPPSRDRYSGRDRTFQSPSRGNYRGSSRDRSYKDSSRGRDHSRDRYRRDSSREHSHESRPPSGFRSPSRERYDPNANGRA